jgi:hypothetical protein
VGDGGLGKCKNATGRNHNSCMGESMCDGDRMHRNEEIIGCVSDWLIE